MDFKEKYVIFWLKKTKRLTHLLTMTKKQTTKPKPNKPTNLPKPTTTKRKKETKPHSWNKQTSIFDDRFIVLLLTVRWLKRSILCVRVWGNSRLCIVSSECLCKSFNFNKNFEELQISWAQQPVGPSSFLWLCTDWLFSRAVSRLMKCVQARTLLPRVLYMFPTCPQPTGIYQLL